MRKLFLRGNVTSALEVTSSGRPTPDTNAATKSIPGQWGSLEKKAVMAPESTHGEAATPSIVTASTGIDDSHVSRYKTIFRQTKQGDKCPRRYEKCVQSTGHYCNPDKHIKSPFQVRTDVKGILHPSHKREDDDVNSDNDHYSDVDFYDMYQNDYSCTEECTSTNALILESNESDNFTAGEADVESRQSSLTDDIYMDDSKADAVTIEHVSMPPMNRISALTEAIAMKQSDIAVQFCSMIQRMKQIVENMEQMQNANDAKNEWNVKSLQYIDECQVLQETATKMAKKQVLLAHQSTKYVERLEQEMLDLQSNCQLLQWSERMSQHQTVPEVTTKQSPLLPLKNEAKRRTIPFDRKVSDKMKRMYDCDDDDDSSTTAETKFGIQEISFRDSIVVNVADIRAAPHDGYITSG